MRSSAAVRLLAGIFGIPAALVMSAPAQADPDCPNGQIISQHCTGDNCATVQTQCGPRSPVLPQGWLPVEVQGGIGIGNGLSSPVLNGPFWIPIPNGQPSF